MKSIIVWFSGFVVGLSLMGVALADRAEDILDSPYRPPSTFDNSFGQSMDQWLNREAIRDRGPLNFRSPC